jgi:hypothetical protein
MKVVEGIHRSGSGCHDLGAWFFPVGLKLGQDLLGQVEEDSLGDLPIPSSHGHPREDRFRSAAENVVLDGTGLLVHAVHELVDLRPVFVGSEPERSVDGTHVEGFETLVCGEKSLERLDAIAERRLGPVVHQGPEDRAPKLSRVCLGRALETREDRRVSVEETEIHGASQKEVGADRHVEGVLSDPIEK